MSPKRLILIILASSLTIQILIITFFPPFFNDFFRYLWDGKVFLFDINPYLTTPWNVFDTPELKYLTDTWYWDQMFFKWSTTIYGPTLIYIFAFSQWLNIDSGLSLRLIFFLFNLGTAGFIFYFLKKYKKPLWLAALVLLNPLFLFDTLLTNHLEAIIMFFFLLLVFVYQKKWHFATGIIFALTMLTKFFPIILLPLLLIGRNIESSLKILSATIVTSILLYLPFLKNTTFLELFESFKLFRAEWVMSPGLFSFMEYVSSFISDTSFILAKELSLIFAGIGMIVTYFVCTKSTKKTLLSFLPIYRAWKHPTAILDAMHWVLFSLMVFSSVIFSWYVLWLLPFIPFIKHKLPTITLSLTILFQYTLLYHDPLDHTTKYVENGEILWNQLIIWVPVLVAIVYEVMKARRNEPISQPL